jgi:hypothetical protein
MRISGWAAMALLHICGKYTVPVPVYYNGMPNIVPVFYKH